jgi:hypothetical protein
VYTEKWKILSERETSESECEKLRVKGMRMRTKQGVEVEGKFCIFV